jgi:peptidoglycan/xylan/chitin deacetylase (PgdA/CDA1 family)
MHNAALRRAALRLAAARGRALVLVYHRVRESGAAAHEVVPALSSVLFQRQIAALGELGDVVPLSELVRRDGAPGRVRFGVSFDDDEPAHVSDAFPILRSLGVRATFFLSGRTLHQIGAYWWVALESLIAEHGVSEIARRLGVAADSPAELARQCEGTVLVRQIESFAMQDGGPRVDGRRLDAAGIRRLADAGMTIAFHTLEHPVLPTLADDALALALTRGRDELARAAGAPITLLAYPHGRADSRVARAAEAAGYDAAFVAGGRPIDWRADRYLLGRWEPGPLDLDDFVAAVALRLNRPPVAR